MSALPLHIWTFILAFNDFSWVTERTDSWDAIGVISYGLIFAFFESLIVFIAITILGVLISKKWEEKRRVAMSSILVIVVSLWAIVGHLYFLQGITVPPQVIGFFVGFDHPLRILYAVTLLLVIPTFVIPTYLVLVSEKFLRFIQEGIERLSLLMTLYLVIDLAAVVIIIIRNV